MGVTGRDGTDKNSGGQVNILGTFPKERVKFCLFSLVLILAQLGTGKNNGGQVDFFDTFPRERLNFSVISIPVTGVSVVVGGTVRHNLRVMF